MMDIALAQITAATTPRIRPSDKSAVANGLRDLAAELKERLARQVDALARIDADPHLSDAGKAAKRAEFAQRMRDEIRAVDDAHIRQRIVGERRRATPVDPEAPTDVAGALRLDAIRRHIAGLPEGERDLFLIQRRHDPEVFAALLHSPYYTLGLAEEQHAHYIAAARDPAVTLTLDNLERVEAEVDGLRERAEALVSELVGTPAVPAWS